MKILIILLLILLSNNLNSQEIKFPFFEERDSKLITINSVVNFENTTILNMEYMCSFKYKKEGYFNINENTFLFTPTKKYKLIDVKNIKVSPEKNYCSQSGQLNKFELVFEKIDDTVKEFHLIECPEYRGCFNIYGINIEKSNEYQYDGVIISNKIKNDKFLSYLDPVLQIIFEKELFAGFKGNFNDYFDKIIEAKYNNDTLLNLFFKTISIESRDKNNAYTFTLKNNTTISTIELFVSKDINKANKITLSRFMFSKDKEQDQKEFFISFCDYYGYTYDSKDISKPGMHIFPNTLSWVSLVKTFDVIPTINITVFTDDEHKNLINKRKNTK